MKKWYLSKTLWFNAGVAVLAAFEGLTGVLRPYLSPEIYAGITLAVPLINAALRVITKEGLTK